MRLPIAHTYILMRDPYQLFKQRSKKIGSIGKNDSNHEMNPLAKFTYGQRLGLGQGSVEV